MTTRAKFECTVVTPPTTVDEYSGTLVVLNAVTSGSEENERFFKATPNGMIELFIKNDIAAERFSIGREYYIDISPASV